jgi:hypothetical protein
MGMMNGTGRRDAAIGKARQQHNRFFFLKHNKKIVEEERKVGRKVLQ